MNSNTSMPFQRYAHDRALGSTVQAQDLNASAAPERHTIRHKLTAGMLAVRETLRVAALPEDQNTGGN